MKKKEMMFGRGFDAKNPNHLQKAANCLYAMRGGTASEEEREYYERAHKEAESIFATFHQGLNEVLASDWWNEETMEIFYEYPDCIVVIDRKSNEIIKTYGMDMEIDRTAEYIKQE